MEKRKCQERGGEKEEKIESDSKSPQMRPLASHELYCGAKGLLYTIDYALWYNRTGRK